MQDILGESLRRLKLRRKRRMRTIAVVLVLSLLVSTDVFWMLRQPGWTLAGDADCKITEHTHTALCQSGGTPCTLTEHVHTLDCYSNQAADTETQLDWEKLFADYPYTGDLQKDLVGLAKTQVGYVESTDNFQVDANGLRHGYSRYGAWYGAPYNDWSAMFVSFCLHFAGADPEQFPGNTGGATMANLWKMLGKYAPADAYNPSPGDLVFFKDNTVGIVTDVQLATICVIRGDMNDAVISQVILRTDSSIAGWGLTKTEQEMSPGMGIVDLLDISNGPVFIIHQEGETQKQVQRYARRYAPTIVDLIPYLEASGGSYFFTLLDKNNQELPKDADGNYIAQAGTGYKLTITFNAPEGFHPGTYQHQIPNGLMVDGGEGTFILKDGTNVGSWLVTDTGLITLEFNDHINSRTDITISATMGIHFPEQDAPIDFDGKITVTVEKPPPQSYPTTVEKWGGQGGTGNDTGPDTSKLYWVIRINGNKDSQILGNILSDRVLDAQWAQHHRYTQSDIEAGLRITAEAPNPNGGEPIWHSWYVSPDDPHLIWTETEWSYKMPHTVVCETCGEIELGNDGWRYYVRYTSTPDPLGIAGVAGYANYATIDGAEFWGWLNFVHEESTGRIHKTGTFLSDAGGGGFLWEVQATIPAKVAGEKALYAWYIMDNLNLYDENNPYAEQLGVKNDANLATVIATYNGTTIQVPDIRDATEDDFFAWNNAWSTDKNGVTNCRELDLLCRCTCNEDNCRWGGNCGYGFFDDNGNWVTTEEYCQCWNVSQEVTFTFIYQTTDLSVLENYGGQGYALQNDAELYYIPEGSTVGMPVTDGSATVSIPGVFKKELTHDFNGYTAHYQVTVNEAKLVLTNGSALTIRDMMTDTLAYISGSLVITAEDANGNLTELRQGADYTVIYDGSGNQKDANGKPIHVLDIVVLHPQPVKYILDYDTTLLMPEQVTAGIKYTNSATITLWGQAITDTTVEKVYADINIAAKSYQVELMKTSAETGLPLPGATFGLYNENGGLITTGTTDANGKLLFQTNTVAGIILREHVLYYVQEIIAPNGYELDSTKHWFCFCNETGNTCGVYKEILAGVNAIRIPFEQVGEIPITNKLMYYQLPETGGPGIYPLILVSVIFIITPLVYMFVLRRKRERRGVR